jgi:uncharacterized protein (TIGR03790 family)
MPAMKTNGVRHPPGVHVTCSISQTFETILQRGKSRNGTFIKPTVFWFVFCSFFWSGAYSAVWADDAPPPPVPSSIHPFLSTNSASSTFLQIHPELAEPASPEQSGLSLHPDAAATNAPPEVIPPGSGVFPDSLQITSPIDEAEDLAAHLLVVYNSNDPDSEGLAQYYASRRGIPAERVLAISSPTMEEITRAEFDDTIRSPIVSYLSQKDWMAREPQHVQVGNRFLDLLVATRNDIWAIVLIRGVPLKIAPDPSDEDTMENQPELQTNAAAVDNELALLPVFGLPLGGYVPNMFFDNQVSGIKHVGPGLARTMVLVTRLDGPTVADVRRMIDDTLEAEQHRLAGLAVVDSRGFTDVKNGYTSGDNWLRSARDMLVKDGWEVKFDDKPDVLPATDPLNHVALYLGWYHDGAIGPWITSPDRFVPGAIAYHLHSFSATTVRSATSAWVGPLIAHGADATMGMVYEPYLALTPHEDIFTRRLLQGDYFAEAAYASERALSWMLTVVGDPLYRPFREPLSTALADAAIPHTGHDDWLLLQQVQREIVDGKLQPTTDNLEQALNVPGAGPIAEEGLGDLLEKLNEPAAEAATEDAYHKALTAEKIPIDRIRVGLKLAQYFSNHGQDARAQSELDRLREADPADAMRFGVSGPLVPTSVAPVAPLPPIKRAASAYSVSPAGLPRPPSLPTPTPVSQ